MLLDAITADAAIVAESVPDAAHAIDANMVAYAMLWLPADAVNHSNIVLQLVAGAAVPCYCFAAVVPIAGG